LSDLKFSDSGKPRLLILLAEIADHPLGEHPSLLAHPKK
jgi:hypothetical protein